MIERADLEAALSEYERQEQQALADANAAHGAQVAIRQLLALCDARQQDDKDK